MGGGAGVPQALEQAWMARAVSGKRWTRRGAAWRGDADVWQVEEAFRGGVAQRLAFPTRPDVWVYSLAVASKGYRNRRGVVRLHFEQSLG